MRGRVYIGTSGWSYPDWEGRFYPAGLPAREHLAFYARRFRTVELNVSFYRLPFEGMIRGWHARAPKGFVFAVKGSRRITHFKKLVDVREDLHVFLERVSGLQEHLGPILWQLPPSLGRDVDRLEAFLDLLPVGQRHAVEFRHASWWDDSVRACLKSRGLAMVSVSSTRMPSNLNVTADFVYVRFHGLAGGYAHDYTKAELKLWADPLRRLVAEGRDVYAYFNNDADAHAPKNALELAAMIRSRRRGSAAVRPGSRQRRPATQA